MIRLVEMWIKGELFFFENSFSEEEIERIAEIANNYFSSEDACISAFFETLHNKYSIKISLARVEKVIAV